ncbi:hypothetical protein C8Q77DRAFT_294725 [Trametes polyzona]|nr:hypothetical protein C8Q77DRAFT_294725 [Trametes polyzona]
MRRYIGCSYGYLPVTGPGARRPSTHPPPPQACAPCPVSRQSQTTALGMWRSSCLFSAGDVLTLTLLRGVWMRSRKGSTASKPPGLGPKGLPLLGNLFDLPRKGAWKTFTGWSKENGDVIYLPVLGRPIILLNSAEATSDLLEGRFGI